MVQYINFVRQLEVVHKEVGDYFAGCAAARP